MPSLRDYLKARVTGNGSEVVLPWFPEANVNSREMRLIRKTRIEPDGSNWINYPLAFFLWTGLSSIAAIKTCWKYGGDTQRRTGLALWKQFMQMLYLAWFKNLSPLDYYTCLMHLPEIRVQAEYYLPPHRQGRLFRQLNAGRPTERLDHKLKAYHSLRAAGLPTVDIVEIFYADGSREFSCSDEDLAKYIGEDFFVKPINMYMAINSNRWMYDAETEQYSDGTTTVPAKDIWATFSKEAKELGKDSPEKQARMVQPLVRNHPDLEPLSRYSLNTLRINMVFFPDGRLEFYNISLRMGYGDTVIDIRAPVRSVVDMENGRLLPGSNRNHIGQALTIHPTTGAQIEGMQVPCWEEVIELARRAHTAFPENPTIGWDIAITPDGPLIVEANCNPQVVLTQFNTKAPLTKGVYADLYWDWMGTD